MRFLIIFSALLITSLTACETKAPVPPVAPVVSEAPEAKMTGSDLDAHGCIAAGGYVWCERTHQCERPWELADKEKFEKTREAFDKYCDDPAQQETPNE